MIDQYVSVAKENMGAIERLLKGLPGIRGYVDKELRRDADKRLRDNIAMQLDEQKQALMRLQQKLMSSGGLLYMDDVDRAVQKLQILVDRVKTASYGYAGLFDPVRVREDQLNALYRFDVALAARVVEVQSAVKGLDEAITSNGEIAAQIQRVTELADNLNTLYNRRHEAITNPDLLTEPDYAPEVDPELMNLDSGAGNP